MLKIWRAQLFLRVGQRGYYEACARDLSELCVQVAKNEVQPINDPLLTHAHPHQRKQLHPLNHDLLHWLFAKLEEHLHVHLVEVHSRD